MTIKDYESRYYPELIKLLEAEYGSAISQEDLEKYYVNDNHEIIIAVDDDDVLVGCSFIEERRDFVRTGHDFYITYVAVDKSRRRMGTGRKLFAEIERRAAERGCDSIEFTSANHRTDAHAFYASLGYTKKKTTVFIKDI